MRKFPVKMIMQEYRGQLSTSRNTDRTNTEGTQVLGYVEKLIVERVFKCP